MANTIVRKFLLQIGVLITIIYNFYDINDI
ncbi:Uncharacterised protein [Moraxella catarrhalis]|nr:putative membrane protein [Moraxella catarrhalis]SQH70744.1 Uncharacterised protein [Moraxella catarrhalis]